MKMLLKDGAPRCKGEVELNIRKDANTVEIGASGVDPAPVVIEYYDGRLKLRVYAEGNAVMPAHTVELAVASRKIEGPKPPLNLLTKEAEAELEGVVFHATKDEPQASDKCPPRVEFNNQFATAHRVAQAAADRRENEAEDVPDGEAMTIGTPSALLNQEPDEDDLSGY